MNEPFRPFKSLSPENQAQVRWWIKLELPLQIRNSTCNRWYSVPGDFRFANLHLNAHPAPNLEYRLLKPE
jgi:hypothetical protein